MERKKKDLYTTLRGNLNSHQHRGVCLFEWRGQYFMTSSYLKQLMLLGAATEHEVQDWLTTEILSGPYPYQVFFESRRQDPGYSGTLFFFYRVEPNIFEGVDVQRRMWRSKNIYRKIKKIIPRLQGDTSNSGHFANDNEEGL